MLEFDACIGRREAYACCLVRELAFDFLRAILCLPFLAGHWDGRNTVADKVSPARCRYAPLGRKESHAMHNRDPTEQFRAPAREPKPGTFHRPAHGFGMKRVREAAELRLSGPMTGEQKLGEGLRELPLVGNAGAARTKGKA